MTFDAKIIRTEREGKLTNGLRVDTGSSSGRAIACSKHDNFVHGVVPLPLLPLLPKCLNAYNRHFGNRQGEGPGDEIAPSIIGRSLTRPNLVLIVFSAMAARRERRPMEKNWLNPVEYLQ